MLKGKLKSLKKILWESKPTKPSVMGNNILFLATAPCVMDYFNYESVRKQFSDYDVACINYMLHYSTDLVFELQPRYLILLDPIFYVDDYFGAGTQNEEKKKTVEILEKVDWKCNVLTSTLADFGTINRNLTFIRLSCFEVPFKTSLLSLYKKNYINMGIFNVMQGAIYYAITFGYKNIAVLGCQYQMANMYMEEDGLHIQGYQHYYDEERMDFFVSNEELRRRKNSYIAETFERGNNSLTCFWNLNEYAKIMGAQITNYSEESAIDAFSQGKLIKN